MKTLRELLFDMEAALSGKESARVRQEILKRFEMKPYDCYWSKRALNGEKILSDFVAYGLVNPRSPQFIDITKRGDEFLKSIQSETGKAK